MDLLGQKNMAWEQEKGQLVVHYTAFLIFGGVPPSRLFFKCGILGMAVLGLKVLRNKHSKHICMDQAGTLQWCNNVRWTNRSISNAN